MRLEIGDNPPESCTAELYEPPPSVMNPGAYGSGGLHLTTEGAAWHLEGGPGTNQKVIKFQIRPDPLAH